MSSVRSRPSPPNKMKTDDLLQWIGAVSVIAGHIFNAIGPSVYPFNIVAFTIGVIMFGSWAVRVKNMPQIAVNIVALIIGAIGLYKAWIVV